MPRRRSRSPIVTDVTPIIDEIYPLYLAVYERSTNRFEKLTKEYFCRLGREMPDKTRFFIWRQEGRVIALSICMLEGDALYAEYLGLDYSVALDLHLYHYAVRDTVSWGMENGYKWFRSSGLNYDPKYHLRAMLDPIDLYVRHTSNIANAVDAARAAADRADARRSDAQEIRQPRRPVERPARGALVRGRRLIAALVSRH